MHINRGNENGLLKVITHPDFDNNGKLYIFYADPVEPWHNIDVITLNKQNKVTDRI